MFSTLTEDAPVLRGMGIHVEEDETERLQRVMMHGSWTTVTGGQREKRRQPRIRQTYKPS